MSVNVALDENDNFFTGTIGDDTVLGLGGNDVIIGILGNDFISGNAGNDFLFGGLGIDVLFGGQGDDTVLGEDDADNIAGEVGNDVLNGNQGNDFISGGDGSDNLFGGKDNDTLMGESENDLLFGGLGIDVLFGGQGDDTVLGQDDADNIAGEVGNDLLNGNQGNDFISGGDGSDSLFGGKDDDTLMGEAENDLLFGDIGNDFLFGNQGSDTLFGNSGIDLIFGGQGDDLILGGQGDDFVSGNVGNDSVSGDVGNDTVGGGPGSDTLEGGEGQDFISGGDENDRLVGDLGNDTLTGGLGGDVFVLINDIGSADVITDFRANEDFMQLGGGLQFSNLVIEQGNGFNINDTVISTNTGQLIAVLLGVPATTITVESFNVPTDLPGDGGGGQTDSTTPRLQGGEVLVADQAGVLGTVVANGATSLSISTVADSTGATFEDALTIDNEGQLSLTEAGATALNAEGVSFLDVTVSTGTDGEEGTIRVYGQVNQALGDEEIGNGTDTSAGGGEDAILVAAGTYEDPVNISESVRLVGANAGVAGNSSDRSEEANLTGGITINGTLNVTINGFQLTGSGINATGATVQIENNQFDAMTETALSVQGLQNGTIANNAITLSDAGAAIDGINADSLTGTTIENNTINTPAAGGSGIELGGTTSTGGASSNVTIANNTVTGSDGAGTANTDGGITLTDGDFTSLTLRDNTVSGYTAENTGSLLIATGTAITDGTQLTITGNVFAPVSVLSASTNVQPLTLDGNFSVEGTPLTAVDVSPTSLFG